MPLFVGFTQPGSMGALQLNRRFEIWITKLVHRPFQIVTRYSGGNMPRVPYVDPETISDPEIRGYLERARREGTPRPESQAVRAHNPNVIRAFSQAWDLTFRNGVVDHALKELCRVYVSKSIDCEY